MRKPRRARSGGAHDVTRCLGLCLALSLAACQQKAAPPPAPRGLPPLDPGAASGPSAMPRAEHPPADPAGHGAMPAGHPPMPGGHPPMPGGQAGHVHGDGKDPHGDDAALEAAAPPEVAFDPKTMIAGQLKLDAKLKDKVKAGDVIYLVARAAGEGGAPGQVVAVKRLEAGAFPMGFTLDNRDAMVVGTQMKGPLVLTVRVDKDGDAMTKNPGDVTGTLTVKTLPAPKLALLLDTEL